MNWFQSLAALLARSFQGRGRQHASQTIRDAGQVTTWEVQRNGIVMGCIRRIARLVGQLDFTSTDAATDALLHRPNHLQTQTEFLQGAVHDLLLYGDTFVRLFRGAPRGSMPGPVMTMALMDPQNVGVHIDRGMPVYENRETGEWLEASQVLHMRDAPGHGVRGACRIHYGGRQIAALIAADTLIEQTFRRGVSLQHAVTHQRSLSPEETEKYQNAYHEAFGLHGDRVGGVLVLGKGTTLTTHKGLTPADGDVRAFRDQLKREIAAIFDMPPFLAGAESDTKYSNYTASLNTLMRDAVAPIVTLFVQAFTIALGAPVGSNMEDLQKGDLKTQVEIGTQASGGPTMTPNEARVRIQDLPALDNPEYDKLRKGGVRKPPSREGETPTDDGATDADEENSP